MIVLVGTVPHETGLVIGAARVDVGHLCVGDESLPVERGTAAMAASCAQVCLFYGLPLPVCVFGGDTGDGRGNELMFSEVNNHLDRYNPDVVVLHYLFPKIAHARPFVDRVNSLAKRPQLIADAGGMYLMKATKQSKLFDVFTPDQGELLFLADEFASHPLYVRSEMAAASGNTDSLVVEAYRHRNAAHTLVVKGAVDRVYRDGVKVGECREPMIPAMEAIGGTGDTITGMLCALRSMGHLDAERKALTLNRIIGKRINCTPATQIGEFVRAIPLALEEYERRHH